MHKNILHIFTDGSCNYKNRLGGVGVYVYPIDFSFKSAYKNTTTARCELFGVLYGLNIAENYSNQYDKIFIYCDNQYAVNIINKGWAKNWEKHGWADRVNSDIIKEILYKYRIVKNVNLIWIKGHQKNNSFVANGNNLADILADYKQFNEEDFIEDTMNLN